MKRGLLPCLVMAWLLLSGAAQAAPLTADSPDRKIHLEVDGSGEQLVYRVRFRQQPLITDSALGMQLEAGGMRSGGARLLGHSRAHFDETWTQPWGEVRQIRNHYNELTLALQTRDSKALKFNIVFRVFDDGIGFRYEWPQQPGLSDFTIEAEDTRFNFAGNYKTWSIPADAPTHYEMLYQQASLSAIANAHTPLTMETDDGVVVALHEAALMDFPAMILRGTGANGLRADLAGWHDGPKAKLRAPHRSSWRTIQIAASARALPTSYLMLNLNEPNKLGDVSWVKPAKYAGVWWEIHLGRATWNDDDPRHGARTANVMKYIDFAADNGLSGVLVEGWNEGWNHDWVKEGWRNSFTRASKNFDMPRLSAYAAQKGVRLIGHHETGGWIQNYERQLGAALDYYRQHGVNTVKTGYVAFDGINLFDAAGKPYKEAHDGQLFVNHQQKVVDEAALRHMMIVAHEPIKDTGLRRTYPNLLSREGARGQEFNAWSDDGGNPPGHDVILPFTRLLAAPMDFTPGIVQLTYEKDKPKNRVNTTLAKQLALYVTVYSPVQMVTDLPENYAAKPDALRFIKDVPVDWEDTKVLHAQIGAYVTFVRRDRGSDDWYLGSITNEQARALPTTFDFLGSGKTWVAEIYRDGEDAHWKTNPHAFVREQFLVTSRSAYTLRLAPGGGQAIRFRPAGAADLATLTAM